MALCGFMTRLKTYIRQIFSSERGHNLLLYLVFVVISFVFWVLMTLNNEIEKDYRVNVKVEDVPDSVTFVSDYPEQIRVTVKDKGSSFLPYFFGAQPTVSLKWSEYSDKDGNFVVTQSDLRTRVLNAFGGGVSLVSMSPNEVRSRFTTAPGKMVPLIIDASVDPNLQYVQSGSLRANVDSVRVYSDRETLAGITSVYTYHFELANLKDTTEREVKIAPIPGVKIVPNKVTVVVPIEPLIKKTISVPIVSRGVPYGMNLVTFPSKIEVRYLVPMSQYKQDNNVRAEVYFDETSHNENKLRLYLNQINWQYGEIELLQDSVDYIIEKR